MTNLRSTRLSPFATRIAGAVVLAGAFFAAASLLSPSSARAQVYVSVGIAPPPIPVYTQPLCPGDGYIWTPGYWAWNDYDGGYEWVDGAWVVAPYAGALWTPGYWGYGPGGYFWNAGYWGREVGYYGGINYGFGYFGTGFYGGYWGGGRFFYNRAYNRLDERRERNIYERRESGFDGRPGGDSFARDGHGFGDRHGDANRGGQLAARNGFAGNQNANFSAVDRNRGTQYDGNRQAAFAGNTNRQPYTIAQPAQNQQSNGYQFNRNQQPTYSQPNAYQPGAQTTRPAYNGGGQLFRQPVRPQTYAAPAAQQQTYTAPQTYNGGSRPQAFNGGAQRGNSTPTPAPAPSAGRGWSSGGGFGGNQGGGSHGGNEGRGGHR